MSWTTYEESRRFSCMPDEPDLEALSYWITRLKPVICKNSEHEIIIVFCNRIGRERDMTYAGTSAVLGIKNGVVELYGILGRGQRETLVVDTQNKAHVHLTHQPGQDGASELTGDKIESHNPLGGGTAVLQGTCDHHFSMTTRDPELPIEVSNERVSINTQKGTEKALLCGKESSLEESINHPRPTTASSNLLPRLVIPTTLPMLPQSPINGKSITNKPYIPHHVREPAAVSRRPPEDSTPHPLRKGQRSLWPFPRQRSLLETIDSELPGQIYDTGTPFVDMTPISPHWEWTPDNMPVYSGLEYSGQASETYDQPMIKVLSRNTGSSDSHTERPDGSMRQNEAVAEATEVQTCVCWKTVLLELYQDPKALRDPLLPKVGTVGFLTGNAVLTRWASESPQRFL